MLERGGSASGSGNGSGSGGWSSGGSGGGSGGGSFGSSAGGVGGVGNVGGSERSLPIPRAWALEMSEVCQGLAVARLIFNKERTEDALISSLLKRALVPHTAIEAIPWMAFSPCRLHLPPLPVDGFAPAHVDRSLS